MKSRPQISDEEIRSYMDFEAVVAKHKQEISSGRKWFPYFVAAFISASVGIAIYFYSLPRNKELTSTPKNILVDSVSNSKAEAPEPIPNVDLQLGSDKKQTLEKNDDDESNKTLDSDEKIKKSIDKKSTEAQPTYVEAQPIEGFPVLYEYFNKELRYPEAAVKDSIEGIVTVFFIINKEGKPAQISIENSLGDAFDQEAFRLIQNMPKWKAATLNGNPVQSRISIPLTFQILKSKKTN